MLPRIIYPPEPNTLLPRAGLALVSGATHSLVFRPDTTTGTYNHAAQVTTFNDTLVAAWHNAPYLEDSAASRVLYSVSADGGRSWSTSGVLFEPLSGEIRNGTNATLAVNGTVVYSQGFQQLDGRQYALGAAYNMRCSAQCRASGAPGSVTRRCCEQCLGCCSCPGAKEKLPELMRSISLVQSLRVSNEMPRKDLLRGGDKRPRGDLLRVSLGETFWLASRQTLQRSYNLSAREDMLPSYDEMPATVRADAISFMSRQLYQGVPAAPAPASLSERSVFVQSLNSATDDVRSRGAAAGSGSAPPKSASATRLTLAMLLRDDGTPSTLKEWASTCEIDGLDAASARALASATARGQHLLLPPGFDARTACNWSVPKVTNIPDSRASTCAGVLPNGTRYLLGNQLPRLWDRDPLTLALSADGVAFGRLSAVRADAPPPEFPAFTKGPGYAYPMAVLTESDDALVVVYSTNKEQIAATRIAL